MHGGLTKNHLDIFHAVQSGAVTRGVVPFENSTNGSVVFTLDLFADRNHSFPDLSVCGEAYLDVHHYLLGHSPQSTTALQEDFFDLSRVSTPTPSAPNPVKPRAQPTTSLKNIKRIYSHPQAFGQCEIFLGAFLKGIERIDVTSTSKAAQLVKEDTTGTSAAIASQIAAEVHNLHVLAKGIEDREDNTTRFFVLRKGSELSEEITGPPSTKYKSFVSFTVDHKSPGALADVLDCFRRHKLNLTSINSRPSRLIPFQYIFFVEFEGSKFQDTHGSVNGALESMAKVAKTSRWLGSWEDELKREKG